MSDINYLKLLIEYVEDAVMDESSQSIGVHINDVERLKKILIKLKNYESL